MCVRHAENKMKIYTIYLLHRSSTWALFPFLGCWTFILGDPWALPLDIGQLVHLSSLVSLELLYAHFMAATRP